MSGDSLSEFRKTLKKGSMSDLLKCFGYMLRHFGVPLDTWGKGEAKSIEDLCAEYIAGETCFRYAPSGPTDELQPMRCIMAAEVDVLYADQILFEERQIFSDGRVRVRALPSSLVEKCKKGNEFLDAASAALTQELGITERLSLVAIGKVQIERRVSASYPGLLTQYTTCRFSVTLPAHLYNSDGYTEAQPSKKSIFKWRKKPTE